MLFYFDTFLLIFRQSIHHLYIDAGHKAQSYKTRHTQYTPQNISLYNYDNSKAVRPKEGCEVLLVMLMFPARPLYSNCEDFVIIWCFLLCVCIN